MANCGCRAYRSGSQTDYDLVIEFCALHANAEKTMRALESLTPNGSEYVGDPDACVAAVKAIQQAQHRQIVRVTKENHALHANAGEMRDALEFYANKDNYQRRLVSDVLMSEMDVDEGIAARAVLAEAKEK